MACPPYSDCPCGKGQPVRAPWVDAERAVMLPREVRSVVSEDAGTEQEASERDEATGEPGEDAGDA